MPDVIIVLGMHRSGTSALAGLLEEAGVALGDVVKVAPHNARGNRERPEIWALNDQVIAFSGGSWNAPPAELRWSPAHAEQRDALISGYSEVDAWGFKDPRTLFTLPFWLDGLRAHTHHYIGTVRHPAAVVASLQARQPDIDPGEWLNLWIASNRRLLELHHRLPFPIVDFDQPANAYLHMVTAAITSLGVTPGRHAMNLRFFEPSLRHRSSSAGNAVAATLGIDRSDHWAAALTLYRQLLERT